MVNAHAQWGLSLFIAVDEAKYTCGLEQLDCGLY